MPGFIVTPKSGSRGGKAGHPGGGQAGGGSVVVHAADETIARQQGATSLGLNENQVTASPFYSPSHDALMRNVKPGQEVEIATITTQGEPSE